MTSSKPAIVLLTLILGICPPLHADRPLDGQKAEKLEIRQSMLGFRNTLIFYIFKEQRAVMALSISNQDETFPVSGKVYLFDAATTGEELKKLELPGFTDTARVHVEDK